MVRASVFFKLATGSLLAATASAAPPRLGGPARTSVDCTGVKAISVKCRSAEQPYHRDFFYVGGHAATTATGTIKVDQIYVEKLTPVQPDLQAQPLVFFHGGGPTGATWLNTPDGREGWASYFTRQGYIVYLVDSLTIGRSAHNNLTAYPMQPGSATESVQKFFTNPQAYNTYPQAKLHTQWPGTGTEGDPVYELFHQSLLPLTTNFVGQELAFRKSGCELLSLLGAKAFVFSHSLSARYPILMSNDCPEFIAGHIALEATALPFRSYGEGLAQSPGTPWGMTNTPVDYVPAVVNVTELESEPVGEDTVGHRQCYLQKAPARQLPKINSVPLLQLTGEASVHVTYDHCLIEFLKQAGGSPEWIQLADIGIKGNGHFMHVEKNNLEIADVARKWIEKKSGTAQAL